VAKKLVLFTYTPRPLDEEAYSKFIREIDYPAFRQNSDILDYSCWRTTESVQGKETFTHFDLIEVADFSNWPSIVTDPGHRGQPSAGIASGQCTATSTQISPRTSRSRSASGIGGNLRVRERSP
jgi:hypothetical protein